MLTRLSGQPMALNPDLIEKAEATPDTVITMIDGHKLVVTEPIPEVVDRIRRWRASVAVEAFTLSAPTVPSDPTALGNSGPGQASGSGIPPLARVLHLPAREE